MSETNEQPTPDQPPDQPPGKKPGKKPRASRKHKQKAAPQAKQRITPKVKKSRRLLTVASAKRRDQFLELFKCHGKISIVVRMMGISRNCVDKWCTRVKGFREELEAASDEYCDRLEEEARRRGVDGVLKDVYHWGEVVGQERHYSDRLLIKLLEGNLPGKYRRSEKTVNHTGGYSVEHGGQVAVNVTIQQAVEAMEAKYGPDLEAVARSRLGVMLPGLSGAGHDGAAALGSVHGPAARGRNGHVGNGHHQGKNGNGNGHH